MTKPHEETWEHEKHPRDNYWTVCRVNEGDVVGANMTAEESQFISAAPDMARTLMLVLQSDMGPNDDLSAAIGEDGKARIRAVLTKAGVL